MRRLFQAAPVAAIAMLFAITRIVAAEPADRIIRGGPIVTVNPAQPTAEAVAIADGILKTGQELSLREGITTAQEGATMKHQVDLLRAFADRGELKLDVVMLPFITEIDAIFAGKLPANEPGYRNRLRIGGVKVVTDGSPQGRTAR